MEVERAEPLPPGGPPHLPQVLLDGLEESIVRGLPTSLTHIVHGRGSTSGDGAQRVLPVEAAPRGGHGGRDLSNIMVNYLYK